MTNIFLSVLELSISTSLIIAVILLLSPLINRRYAAKWKYWIWVFLALRLMMPFDAADVKSMADSRLRQDLQFTLNTGEGDADSASRRTVSRGRIMVEIPVQMTAPVGVPYEKGRTVTLLDMAALVWATGSLLFLFVHLASYIHYRNRALKRGTVIVDTNILRRMFELKRELGIRDFVRIIEYQEADSPMVTGFSHPVLILPKVQYSPGELYFILRHELIHLKRRDVYMKLLLTAANALHWFNPLVWFLQKEAAVDMELSCDERVMQDADYEMRKAYTETLLSTLHKGCKRRTVLSTQFYGGKKIMKKRFKNILLDTRKKSGAVVFLCAAMLTLSVGALVGCSVANTNLQGISDQPGGGNAEDRQGQPGGGNAEDRQGQPGGGNAEDRQDQPGGGNAEDRQDQPGDGSAEDEFEILAYIEKLDGGKLAFDEIEWVEVPGERAEELGITEDDAPSGFSVYNEDSVKEEISLADGCICTILDWTSNYAQMQVTPEELADILADREGTFIPYHLTIKNHEITGITEQYVP